MGWVLFAASGVFTALALSINGQLQVTCCVTAVYCGVASLIYASTRI